MMNHHKQMLQHTTECLFLGIERCLSRIVSVLLLISQTMLIFLSAGRYRAANSSVVTEASLAHIIWLMKKHCLEFRRC